VILGADLEEGAVGEPAIGIAPRGAGKVGQDRRTHDLEIGADRVDQAQLGLGAAEQRRVARRHEGEGHRLDEAACRQGAADEADAALRRIEGRPWQRRRALERHRFDRIVAV